MRGEQPPLPFSCLEAGELYLEGDNPSTRKRGFSPSRPPTFPSTAWGCRPKTLRSAVRYAHYRVFLRKTRAFFCKNHKKLAQFRQRTQKLAFISAKTFSMSQKSCVRASKVRVRTARSMRFWRKCGRILLTWRIFGESASAHCFPEAFSGKVRTHFAFMACFRGKCACARLAWRDFGESALAHCFHRKAEPCLRLFVCSHRSHFCRFTAKNTKIRGVFLGKVRVREGATARFGGKCAFIMAIGAKIIRK